MKLWNAAPWVLFSLCYFALTLTSPFYKELWFDELISLHVDRLPTLRDVWGALEAGADGMPPLFHIATRAAHAAFPDDAFAARLPAVVGYWVFLASVWTVVRRRFDAACAWASLAPALLPGPFYFATEGRAYGLMLAFSGLALASWQRAVEPGRPRWTLAALALALCAAVSSHYFAVFLTVPIGLVELERLRGRRRMDWAVLACCLLVALPLAVHFPLTRAAVVYVFDHTLVPGPFSAVKFHVAMLAGIGPALMAALLAASAAHAASHTASHGLGPVRGGLTRDELLLAAGLLLIPFAILAVSYTVTHTFIGRYGITAMMGTMLLSAHALWLVTRTRVRTAAVFAAVLCTVLSLQRASDAREAAAAMNTAADLAHTAQTTSGTVLIEDGLGVLPALYYAPPDLRGRLRFVLDAKAAMRETGLGNPEVGLEILQRYMEPFVVDLDDQTSLGREFWVLINPRRPSWLLNRLERDGAAIRLISRRPSYWLLQVRYTGAK